jgi:hypothetical protein
MIDFLVWIVLPAVALAGAMLVGVRWLSRRDGWPR